MAKARKSKPRSLTPRTKRSPGPAGAGRLLDDVRRLIDEARQQVAQAVNAGLVTLYWHIGRRIRQEILGEQRAAYGEQIVSSLSTQLTAEYLTELPPREVLQRKLHDAIRLAREQLARRAKSPEAVPRLERPSTSPRQRKKRR